mgnify:CR=1 FL=1
MEYEDIVTVAVVNFKPEYGKKSANLKRMQGFCEAAAKQGADIVLLPEMCLTGYDYYIDEDISIAEKINEAEYTKGPSAKAISEIAKRYGIYIVYGAAELDHHNNDLYNSAFIISPEGILGTYRKIHPYGKENTWCQKGNQPYLLKTPWGPVGIGICYDTYQFPELMRHYVNQGARLYLNPTAQIEEINFDHSREHFKYYYQTHLEYGAACNTIFIASSNLTGYDKFNYFAGGSVLLGPKITPFTETDIYYYAGSPDNAQEGIFLATIDLSLATTPLVKNNEYSHTADYRPSLYRNFL